MAEFPDHKAISAKRDLKLADKQRSLIDRIVARSTADSASAIDHVMVKTVSPIN